MKKHIVSALLIATLSTAAQAEVVTVEGKLAGANGGDNFLINVTSNTGKEFAPYCHVPACKVIGDSMIEDPQGADGSMTLPTKMKNRKISVTMQHRAKKANDNLENVDNGTMVYIVTKLTLK